MSAVEQYESMKQDRLGADVIAMYADTAIAELEAQLEHQKLLTQESEEHAAFETGLNGKSIRRAEQAEAAIAELEAENRRLRNCENCAFCLEAGEGEPCLSCVAKKDDTPSQWAPVCPN